MIYSFTPIEPEHPKILILGTMPSVRSLVERQYYGHPQNRFWPLLFALWDLPAPAEYEKRTAFLLKKQIALWDVLASCEREGSLDAAIRRPVPNRVGELLRRHPGIHTVFLNGQKAETLYRRLIEPELVRGVESFVLPSSSPARAMPFDQKLAAWRIVRARLEAGEK